MTDDTSRNETHTEAALRLARRALRRVRAFQSLISSKIDHAGVVTQVREDGILSGRYIFMIVMACAIATLGLLLSSPAVIIGAMLISPLMGPIMLMGFSLSLIDFPSLRRAMITLAAGVAGALLISIFIVKLSPLNEATPEILARTRPNFFDLLVAVFSGLAGGYAVITGKGATIVGVAIATALMPPLAVTGFGIAVGSMPVAGGAFFLFMTNLLAIALSVTVLSLIYGFGAGHGPRETYWRAGMVVVVFIALSIPLGLALRDIAYETRTTNIVRENLLSPFDGHQARVADYQVTFPRGGPVAVEATIRTRELAPDAEEQIQTVLSQKIGRNVVVNVDQVLIDEDKDLEAAKFLDMAESSLGAPLRAEIQRLDSVAANRQREQDFLGAITFTTIGADVDGEARTAKIFAAPNAGLSLPAYRTLEAGLAANFPDWTVTLVPPVEELPLIGFDDGASEPAEGAAAVFEDCLWALDRWGVTRVDVVGYASTSGSRRLNTALAAKRAEAVAAMLAGHGLAADPVGDYRAYDQVALERRDGVQRFQSVLIRPK
ncbi:MAG: DUF389 domain-containing protein [Hyphomonas sp.]|nr:DUF389 domain-containing protein [Hyphomonas sp.]